MRHVAVVALSVVSALSGCECKSDDLLAKTDGPPAAKIVWRTTTSLEIEGQGHFVVVPTGIGTSHAAVLLVDGRGKARLPERDWSGKTAVEIAASPDGARLAYRGPGAGWRVAYVMGKDHVFVSDEPREALAWEAVPAFREAAPKLYAASSLNKQKCVLEEVREGATAEQIAAFLVATADVSGGAEWDGALEKLASESKPPVLAALETHLRGGTGPGLRRALEHLPIEDDRFASALAAVIDRLGPPPGKPSDGPVGRADALATALRAHATSRPAEAGDLACTVLGRPGEAVEVVDAALWALMRAKKRCVPADALLVEQACDRDVACVVDPKSRDDCDDTAKSARELAALSHRAALPKSRGTLVAAWASAVDPPPDEIVLQRARRAYAIDGAGPACPAAAAGAPCRCEASAVRRSLCEVRDGRGATAACTYRVDDDKKRIREVTSAFDGRIERVHLARNSDGRVRGCGIDPAARVVCFDIERDETKAPVVLRRPSAVEALDGARAIALERRTVCAAGDKGVACLGTGDDAKLRSHDFGAPVRELGFANGGLCGLLDSGDVVCSFYNQTRGNRLEGVSGVKSFRYDDSFAFLEMASGTTVRVACGADRCNVMPDTPKALEGEVRVRAEDGDRGCALEASGAVRCWRGDGAMVKAVDDARSIAVVASFGLGESLAVAVRADGRLWTWNLESEGPSVRPLFR